jgi:hypothetical protein
MIWEVRSRTTATNETTHGGKRRTEAPRRPLQRQPRKEDEGAEDKQRHDNDQIGVRKVNAPAEGTSGPATTTTTRTRRRRSADEGMSDPATSNTQRRRRRREEGTNWLTQPRPRGQTPGKTTRRQHQLVNATCVAGLTSTTTNDDHHDEQCRRRGSTRDP